jgi:hypothetical protein
VWKRRFIEAFAILTVGDGLIEFLAPKGHSRLWVVGPESTRRIGKWFVEEPNRMRSLVLPRWCSGCGWPSGNIGIFERLSV